MAKRKPSFRAIKKRKGKRDRGSYYLYGGAGLLWARIELQRIELQGGRHCLHIDLFPFDPITYVKSFGFSRPGNALFVELSDRWEANNGERGSLPVEGQPGSGGSEAGDGGTIAENNHGEDGRSGGATKSVVALHTPNDVAGGSAENVL